MTYSLILISSLIIYTTYAAFERYEGANCGFVHDADLGATYPLDTCITTYTPSNPDGYKYTSRLYTCTETADGANIEALTYYDQDCSGSISGDRSVTADVYSCGEKTEANNMTLDDCFVEYREYSTCNGWETAGYTTKYVMVGTCIGGPDGYYSFATCTNANVSEVRFNDAECCDLSYSYTGSDGPLWSMMVTAGCSEDEETFIGSWDCSLPVGAENAYSDNMDEECMDDASILMVGYAVWIGFIASFLS